MSSEEEVYLEESEYPLAIKIFRILYWSMLLILVLTVFGGLYLLFKGYPWYFVIPGYFVVNLFFRVWKNYFRNILEELEDEQEKMGEQTF